MSAWKTARISEIGTVYDGPHATPKTIDEGPLFLGIPSLKAGRLDLTNSRHVSEEDFRKWTRRVEPQAGDFVFSYETKIGEAALIPEGLRCCLGRRMGLVRLDRQKCDPKYFLYQYLSPGYQRFLASRTVQGATVDRLLLKEFYDFEFPLPPIGEQKSIAAILGSLDDKIELNRRMSATLEEMARALYRSWFVDFDPVHARALSQAPAHMDVTTAALFPDSFGPEGLPKGWEAKRLGDIVTLNYGKALKKDLREPGPYPVYGSGGTDTTHLQPLIKAPTIIVGRKGTVGSVMWEPRGCWPIDTTFYVTTDLPMPFVLRTLQHLPLADMNTDAAVPGLNRENAYRLEVAVPPVETLTMFDKVVGGWQAKIDQSEVESRTLATLRDTLLPRLMSSELRIREAEKQVEEVV